MKRTAWDGALQKHVLSQCTECQTHIFVSRIAALISRVGSP
jgi:hypothetical protein